MPETLEQRTKDILRSYLHQVKALPNESAKRARFASMIGELFPRSAAIAEYARGVEKLIRIRRPEGEKRGRADSFYGNAIIEFEKSLAATLADAEDQLREYIAGSWQSDGSDQSMLAIASDGVTWRVYRPILIPGSQPSPETVNLDLLWDFTVSDETLSVFLALANQLSFSSSAS